MSRKLKRKIIINRNENRENSENSEKIDLKDLYEKTVERKSLNNPAFLKFLKSKEKEEV